MDTILAEQGLRLNYLRDPSRHEAFDPCRILDDLHRDGAARAMLPWQSGLRMAGSDHLVVATDSRRHCLGVIAASDHATPQEPFLLLDAAYLAPTTSASQLLPRMLAYALLRLAGNEAVPTVIAACVQTACYLQALRAFGQRFNGAALFPAAPDAVVIDLGMASLARRIQRVVRPGSRCAAISTVPPIGDPAHLADQPGSSQPMPETLVVIDLSAASEAAILEAARGLYRLRPSRSARRGFAPPEAAVAAQPAPSLRGVTAV